MTAAFDVLQAQLRALIAELRDDGTGDQVDALAWLGRTLEPVAAPDPDIRRRALADLHRAWHAPDAPREALATTRSRLAGIAGSGAAQVALLDALGALLDREAPPSLAEADAALQPAVDALTDAARAQRGRQIAREARASVALRMKGFQLPFRSGQDG